MDLGQSNVGTGWRHWCHVMGNTYGTWLLGDGRGFRTRHHRDHVDGDYKHPPPQGKYREEHATSQDAMKRPPVVLSVEQRQVACRAMVERLLRENVEVIEWVVTAKHFHGLARFTPWIEGPAAESPQVPPVPPLVPPPVVSQRHGPLHSRPVQIDPRPRQMVGLAKKHASHIAREKGMGVDGGLWAVRCKVEPIKDRQHQVNVVKYLQEHVEEGGVLWTAILAQMTDDERAALGKPHQPPEEEAKA